MWVRSRASRLREKGRPEMATDVQSGDVRVRVPAKINLSLRVGPARPDGYHDLTTIFHAVSLFDEITVAPGAPGTGRRVTLSGSPGADVPIGDDNLAARAAVILARRAGLSDPDVSIGITKSIPVAGGMAGGSADAAAALVGCRRLWRLDISDADLLEVAAELGSDVPFALMGNTARGTGRGEQITAVLTSGELHWVIALSQGQLPTPAVYAEWDALVAGGHQPADGDDTALVAALRTGDPERVAPELVNDLQQAALSLRPALADVLHAGTELGALTGIVSGSGPTCVFLCRGRENAISLAAELAGTGLVRSVRHAVGPVPGARLF